MPIEVCLPYDEARAAAEVGRKRRSMHAMIGHKNVSVMDAEESDILSCISEYIVSKTFGLNWDNRALSFEEWKKQKEFSHDVGPCEVKVTGYRNKAGDLAGRLWIHNRHYRPKVDDEAPFILIWKRDWFNYSIRGFAFGKEIVSRGVNANWYNGLTGKYLNNLLLRSTDELSIWIEKWKQ